MPEAIVFMHLAITYNAISQLYKFLLYQTFAMELWPMLIFYLKLFRTKKLQFSTEHKKHMQYEPIVYWWTLTLLYIGQVHLSFLGVLGSILLPLF